MMTNYEERVEFWGATIKGNYADLIAPLKFMDLSQFIGKSVLEIGPGTGAMYNRIKKLSHSYSIADISQAVLDLRVFDEIAEKYIIEDYSVFFGKKYDIVHFWFVVHHILVTELKDFVSFVARHAEEGIYFNYPESDHYDVNGGDGLGTTHFEQGVVENAFEDNFRIIRTASIDHHNYVEAQVK